jgi:pimeloyl-ACP methyl ester carboxylesterase
MGNVMYSIVFQPPNNDRFKLSDLENKGANTFALKNVKHNLSIVGCIVHPKIISDKYIVYSHGNALDIYGTLDYQIFLANKFNVNCLCYDYPGYGKSTGKMCEENCYNSLKLVMSFLIQTKGVLPKNITLLGRSLGTGVVVDYACNNNWSNPIILISPYKSIITVVTDIFLGKFIDKFESLKKIKDIKCPVKIFHGELDEIINISHGIELYNAIPEIHKLRPTWIKETGHGDILIKINDNEILEILNYNTTT